MMNKAEMIEAHWLFNVPPENIQVVIHPQSIVHLLVQASTVWLLRNWAILICGRQSLTPWRIPTGRRRGAARFV